MTRCLALDLGTKCGYAIDNGPSGTWNLAPSRFDSAGIKFVTFKRHLTQTILEHGVMHIVYEEVRMHMAIDAAHAYGGFLSVLQLVALDSGVSYEGVPVGVIKKHATGKGNAKKPDMILAASRLFPKTQIKDDNHADALCLLSYWRKENPQIS